MNPERQLIKARLADCRDQKEQLELQGESLLITLRQTLDPYADSIADLNTDRASQAMSDLHACARELRGLNGKIRRLEEGLHG